jgi:hypothetical protein
MKTRPSLLALFLSALLLSSCAEKPVTNPNPAGVGAGMGAGTGAGGAPGAGPILTPINGRM